jgi:hypothetical protein
MSFAIEKILTPSTGHPERPSTTEADQKLSIAVIFTSVESTLEALEEAGTLACSLGARITLLVPQVVPYPLPLESPPVLLEFNEKRFKLIASQSPVETTVRIYLCRDSVEILTHVLGPGSIVVIGGKKRWWPTREKKLARQLHRDGHQVFFKETE